MPRLETTTPSARVDEPLDLRCTGLKSGQTVGVHARLANAPGGHPWTVETAGRADETGCLQVGDASATLITGMGGADGLSYTDTLTGEVDDLTVAVEIHSEGVPLARRTITRTWGAAGDDHRGHWRDQHVAEVFYPQQRRGGVVLVLGGAWGGFCWSAEVAALLAAEGHTAAALSVFDWDGDFGRPRTLDRIPLEYAATACDRLASMTGAAAVDLVGISKGAELALVLAARRGDIGRMVLVAPSSHVWESVRNDPSAPPHSSWTHRERELAYLPFYADADFYTDLDKTRLGPFHERALQQAAHDHPARIPAELVSADVLLLALEEDPIWPSARMARSVEAAICAGGGRARSAVLPGRGHTLYVPGLPCTTADADRWAWQALVGHLAR